MRRLLAIALLCPLLTIGPAQAQDGGPGLNPGESIGEAAESMMRLFDSLIGSIPQYEAPEVLPNGDIIIRRKPETAVPDEPAPRNRSDAEDDGIEPI